MLYKTWFNTEKFDVLELKNSEKRNYFFLQQQLKQPLAQLARRVWPYGRYENKYHNNAAISMMIAGSVNKNDFI